MSTNRFSLLAGLILGLSLALASAAEPMGTAFTYQGELVRAGAPANGSFDLQFELFDAASLGAALALPLILEDVPVQDGLFTVQVDFGAVAFAGDRAWIELGVRDGASSGGFTGLLPRQEVTPAPYALLAAQVGENAVGSFQLVDGSVRAADIDANEVQRRVTGACAAGSAIRSIAANGSVTCQVPAQRPMFRFQGIGFAVKTIPAGATLEVDIWEAMIFNVGNAFNTSTRRFVAPQAGYYYLHAVVDQANGVTTSLFGISFNVGSTDQFVQGSYPLAEISGIYRLTAGAQVWVTLRNYGDTQTRVDGSNSLFEGYLIE